LHRLRRIFGTDDALILADTRLSLNPALFWVDAWALDHVITELDSALRDPGTQSGGDIPRALVNEALAIYAGPFLPDEAEQPSYIAYREQLRAKLLRSLARVAKRWEEAGTYEAAVDAYLQCIDADELCESFYRGLMQCYQRQGEHVEALSTYERLRTLLATRLNATPAPETQTVYAALLASRADAPRA
jgi:LuxR family maltose regulon positive regulatory protein